MMAFRLRRVPRSHDSWFSLLEFRDTESGCGGQHASSGQVLQSHTLEPTEHVHSDIQWIPTRAVRIRCWDSCLFLFSLCCDGFILLRWSSSATQLRFARKVTSLATFWKQQENQHPASGRASVCTTRDVAAALNLKSKGETPRADIQRRGSALAR